MTHPIHSSGSALSADPPAAGVGMNSINVDEGGEASSSQERRAAEHRAAQHLIRAVVDFLAAEALRGPSPYPIGSLINLVLARGTAQSACRYFLDLCDRHNQVGVDES
jgi:hypothetical protein